MTNGEKATALLSWLDEQDVKAVINILHPMCSDGDLADEYDRLVSDGFIEEPRRSAKRIAFYDESDKCWENMTDLYQDCRLDEFVERAKELCPEIIRNDDVEEIEGEILDESDRYILTWEDGMDECVRIYEKV